MLSDQPACVCPVIAAIVRDWAGIVGRGGIKPLTWYRLGADGAPQECEVAQ